MSAQVVASLAFVSSPSLAASFALLETVPMCATRMETVPLGMHVPRTRLRVMSVPSPRLAQTLPNGLLARKLGSSGALRWEDILMSTFE